MKRLRRLALALGLIVLFFFPAGAYGHPGHTSCQPLSQVIAGVAKAGEAGEFMRAQALAHQVAESTMSFHSTLCEPSPGD